MYSDNRQFEQDPRAYALQLLADGLVDAESLLNCALQYMSTDDVQGMLDANELSPHFSSDYNEDEDEDEDEEERDPMDDFNYVGSRHHY
jgi:hypothetical protein